MSQGEINDREWEKRENWIGPLFFKVYRSSRDARLFVPKRQPWTGITFNFGHPRTMLFVWMFVIVIVTVIAVGVTNRH